MRLKQLYIIYVCVIGMLIISVLPCCGQTKIRVQGVITDISTNKPIMGVCVVCKDIIMGYSDRDGKYVVNVPNDVELLFYSTLYGETRLNVENRQIINLELKEKVIELGEVIVMGKMSTKKIVIDQTDIEIKGNYFHLKTKFRAPKKLFTTDKRFIVQPTILDATKNQRILLRPVVIDGENFEINQSRLFGFDTSEDKLQPYIVENELGDTDHIYIYHDSVFVDRKNIDNDFKSDCYLALAGYSPQSAKREYQDSVTIAKGTQNVLRFFDYSFAPQQLTDTAYIPKPEMQLMSERGVSRLTFVVGKAQIDSNNPNNLKEIDNIGTKISNILGNELATIKSISVRGYTSPEGLFASNNRLAQERASLILQKITGGLSEAGRKYIAVSSSAMVEPWSRIADLIEEDSLPLAKTLRKIIFTTKDDYARSQAAIMRLAEYRSVIAPTYLPELRRVEYEINYSIFRNLTDQEIKRRFDSGNRDISRYEYYRLIECAESPNQREVLEYMALKDYPDFALVANSVAVRLISKDSVDMTILEPLLKSKAPEPLVYNQALMALMNYKVEMADSLIHTLPLNPHTSYLKSVLATLNGRYDEGYPVIASKGGLNHVLLLLCLNHNNDADQQIRALLDEPANSNNAKMWYVRAICSNRTENITWAIESMKKAIELDPKLESIARLDSDVNDIIEIIKPKNRRDEK